MTNRFEGWKERWSYKYLPPILQSKSKVSFRSWDFAVCILFSSIIFTTPKLVQFFFKLMGLKHIYIYIYWDILKTYFWWKKSCTTWDVQGPVNNGINYLSTGAGFLPSTVWYIEVPIGFHQKNPLFHLLDLQNLKPFTPPSKPSLQRNAAEQLPPPKNIYVYIYIYVFSVQNPIALYIFRFLYGLSTGENK